MTPARRPATPTAEPVDAAAAARWRERLDALTQWCLSDLPLTPTVAGLLAGGRPTLGDLLRRALARDGAGIVDLLDALESTAGPAARALLGRVLGGDRLLVVLTVADGTLARADARACRSDAEARALLDAFLGASPPAWAAELGVVDAAGTRAPVVVRAPDGEVAAPSSGTPGAAPHHSTTGATIVLPFLPLGGDAAPLPTPADDPFAIPAILGGTMRPGAAFLDALPGPTDDDEVDARRRRGPDDDEEDAPADGPASDERTEDRAANDADAEAADDDEPDEPDDDKDAAAPDASGGRAADPEPVADFGGALDRLRARTAIPVDRVSMLIATDDGVAEHVADVAAWLGEASEQELRALARGGWSGDSAVDVALALADDDPEALEVVQLARRHECELVVEIDPREAMAWLGRHRPEVARRLAGAR